MKRVDEIKFYFSGWNLRLLAVLVAILVLLATCAFNVPTSEEAHLHAKVVSLGITNSTKYSASYSSVRVKLADGKFADITLPRDVVLQEGDEIIVTKKNLFLRGSFYEFGHKAKNP